MEKIKQVLAILEKENFKPIVKTETFDDIDSKEIIWTDNNGEKCSILEGNIAIENSKIAWLQSSLRENHILKIYDKDITFTWTPITYDPAFGCLCLLLEWYKEHLIFIYQEKHNIYICSTKENEVKHFHFHGEEIERKKNLISYDTYMNKSNDRVRLIQIPELIELEPIDKSEAEKLGLLPKDLNRSGNFLGFK